MTLKKFFLFVIPGLLLANSLPAQELSIKTDTLVWQVNQLKDLPADSVMGFHCEFIVYPKKTIEWVQSNNYKIEFRIISSTGNWSDPTQPGIIEYIVSYKDKTGKIIISKDIQGVEISLMFLSEGRNTMPQVYYVRSVMKMI